ncbi:MAG: long-chain acyl-CoA synthetase [Gammaproteobacteria bacterium HGW-Gammaproteobacteria-11]|nr:MAG: long-chain acyl-CoA synthetase [Gammaproteobacteria bacterium HGW-Gammaproteobacteria-11]
MTAPETQALEAFWARLAQLAESQPAQPALCAGNQVLDYAQLLSAIEQRTALLRDSGSQVIALAMENGIDWLVWDLAILKAQRVGVPIPGFFSREQLQHVFETAGVDTLIGTLPAHSHDLQQGFSLGDQGLRCRDPVARNLPAGTAKITFTSGSTGQPKGVCLSAEHLLRVATSLRQACAPVEPQRHLVVLPLAVLLDNVGVYAALLAGAAVTLPADSGLRGNQLDIARLLQLLRASQPHSLVLVPQLLHALLQAAKIQPLPDSLRFVAVGGGRVAPVLLEQAATLGIPVFEGYGLSECGSVVCLNRPGHQRLGSVGQALPHCRLSLADDGEVLVHDAGYLGYLGDPTSPPEPLPTGDIGRLENGYLTLLGRKKNQFITAFGRNVNPEWIEAELCAQPAIAQALVQGEALPVNLALIVPRQIAFSQAQLASQIAQVNAGLPDYAHVHHWLVISEPFSTDNGLLTGNGRLRRDAILTHYQTELSALIPEEISA